MKRSFRTSSIVLGAYLTGLIILSPARTLAVEGERFVSTKPTPGAFPLALAGSVAPWYVSSSDYPGVLRIAGHLQADVERVTGTKPQLIKDGSPSSAHVVLAGTLGRNPLIDRLVREKKIGAADLAGKWEMYVVQVVQDPFPGVASALVVVGSDKRGTIYGMYEISRQIGVSPWYWWADVPAKKSKQLFISGGRHTDGEPAVKYRGIFINDEAPAMSGWTTEKFGGFNSKMYEHMFELILRLKGNFLWPAMWGNAFYDDDPENPRLADEYGIVISTSHHEPMMRAHDEWRRYGKGGAWNYEKNEKALREFWSEGIRRMGSYESVVSLAMRGDGDEAMSPDANVGLLERIVKDQRQIINEVTGKDVTATPQVWALYKEVQEYYDKGMRVPDDVTVLQCDDNWGNIRKLPDPRETKRSGGYGIYYHFDFVGGPRNYKWLNTTQNERVWEQMHLAYRYNARQIWVVNVGDLKPMELPISFFLDYAWDPARLPLDRLADYSTRWAEEQFGPEHAAAIARILDEYTKFNSRRKPEMLSPGTYSLVTDGEGERIVQEYADVVRRAENISAALPHEYKDAFYQLVLHQPLAAANLNDMYVSAGLNRLYAAQGRAATNDLASRVKRLYTKDAEITKYYNGVLSGGKWNHMMDQTHIGYTNWQQPEVQSMPEVKEIEVQEKAGMGVAVEGSSEWWPDASDEPLLPEIDVIGQQRRSFEIFNRGKAPFQVTITPDVPWVTVDQTSLTIEQQTRVWVSVDAKKVPEGRHKIPITIAASEGTKVVVDAVVVRPAWKSAGPLSGFFESDGVIAIAADAYTGPASGANKGWLKIPNLGRTGSSMSSTQEGPPFVSSLADSMTMDYRTVWASPGEKYVDISISPLLKFQAEGGGRFGVSFDDETPQIVDVHKGNDVPDWKYPMWWNNAVSNNIRVLTTTHTIRTPGVHVFKIWRIDPGVVVQKVVARSGPLRPTYLGPTTRSSQTYPKD